MIFDNLKKKHKNSSVFEDLCFSENSKKNNKNEIIEDNSLSGMNLPDHYVAIPHYLSQSALYAPRNGTRVQRKEFVEEREVWSQGNMTVKFKGPLLDTKIDNKLMSLVLKARDLQPEGGNLVKLKYRETMKALGLRPSHPNSQEKFKSSLERHFSSMFIFSLDEGKQLSWKSLFVTEESYVNADENILHIQLGSIVPKLFKLKETGSFSIEDMFLNFALKGSYSSKLYSYYESNEHPFPVKMSTLLEICDKKIEDGKKPTNNHRKAIKEALEELKSIGFLKDWNEDKSMDKRDPLVIVSKRARKERKPFSDKKFNLDYIYGIKK